MDYERRKLIKLKRNVLLFIFLENELTQLTVQANAKGFLLLLFSEVRVYKKRVEKILCCFSIACYTAVELLSTPKMSSPYSV